MVVTSINSKVVNKGYSYFTEDLNSNKISTVIVDTSPKMTVILNSGDKYSTDNPHTDTLKENYY